MGEASLADVKSALKTDALRPFGAVLRLDAKQDGAFSIDGRGEAVTIADSLAATCTLYGDLDVFAEIVEGETDIAAAFLAGKINAAGDISVLARLEMTADD